MNYYKRNLPHWQPPEAEYFITFRLAGSLPKQAINNIQQFQNNVKKSTSDESIKDDALQKNINRKVFKKYENLLEKGTQGPHWLQQNKIAQLVSDAIKYRDGKKYILYCYCIMPNHVHFVFKLLKQRFEEKRPVTKILHSLKRFTAREANKLLNRKGQFWQHESFDRIIRDHDELEKTITYTLNNPVKANLIKHWENWPHSFCKPEFKEFLM